MRLLLAAIAVLVLALAACGGGDDGRAKAAWIAGADAICARVNSEIDALGEPDTLVEIAEYAADVQPIAERQLAETERANALAREYGLAHCAGVR